MENKPGKKRVKSWVRVWKTDVNLDNFRVIKNLQGARFVEVPQKYKAYSKRITENT